MSNTLNTPLPDGLMDELLDQLPAPIRLHLMRLLCDLNTVSFNQTIKRADQTPKQSTIRHLQKFILSNITYIGDQFLSHAGHNVHHSILLCRLLTTGYLSNLTELDLRHDQGVSWSNDRACDEKTEQPFSTTLRSLVPSIISSLPKLKSLTLPKLDYSQHRSIFFSLSSLFPIGESSSIEKLSLVDTRLSKAYFKFLALHSHYTFPLLTELDVSGVDLDDDPYHLDHHDHSSLHYLLRWAERSMPRLAHLSLSDCLIPTPDIIRDLANSPILSQLESLDLSDNFGVEAKGWQALFTSTRFTDPKRQYNPPMKTLKLDNNRGIQNLIPHLTQDCPYLANLTTLSLNNCNLDDHSVRSICDSKWIRGLKSLLLKHNDGLTSTAARLIADRVAMRNLTSLEFGLHPGQFSFDLLRYITRSQHLAELTRIEIDLAGIPYDQSVEKVLLDFFHSPKASAITKLVVIADSIPESTMKSIMLSPTLTNLQYVAFRNFHRSRSRDSDSDSDSDEAEPDQGNDALNNNNGAEITSGRTNEWFDAFVSSSNCRQINTLSLPRFTVTDSNILAMSQSRHLSALRVLDLSDNPAMTDDSVKHLTQSEGLWLKVVHFKNNSLLTPLSIHHLAQSPRTLTSLEELSLLGCPLIGKTALLSLAQTGGFDGVIDIGKYP